MHTRSGWHIPVIAIGIALLAVVVLAVWAATLKPTSSSHGEGANASDRTSGEEMTLLLGNSGVSMTFCWCPPGSFQRGSSDNEGLKDETPAKGIAIRKGFWMAKTETTQAQWTAVMVENPSEFKGDTLPVEMISHTQAVEYALKLKAISGLNVRLPTEAEWEYACRAGTPDGQTFWCEAADVQEIGWYLSNSGNRTHSVGEKNRPNLFGLHDMHGNVWELCADWYDGGYYAKSPKDDPQGPESGTDRVIRGGSWLNDLLTCRSAYRRWIPPEHRSSTVGFRLVVVPSGP